MGRCYAALGDEPAAIDKYEAYLKAPSTDAHARAQAQAALRQLSQQHAEPTPVFVTAPSERSPAAERGTGAGRGRIIAGWVATALFAAGTAVVGVMALDSANKLKTAREAFPGNGPDIANRASRTTTLTVSADALGVATALIGGLTLYWTLSGPSSSSELTCRALAWRPAHRRFVLMTRKGAKMACRSLVECSPRIRARLGPRPVRLHSARKPRRLPMLQR